MPMPVRAQSEAVCAEVRIEIRQKLSLERQAFDAVLRLRNGLTTSTVDDVEVNLSFLDDAGNAVVASANPEQPDALFFVALDETEGLGAVDGTGQVAAASTGSATWLIVPAASAGGESPTGRSYRVGAQVRYRIGGEMREVTVTPETITVRPQPKLALDYFLASDVYADDAFTPELEPAEPFTLGVRVANVGFGSALNAQIASAQPRIVENTQGLLIDFQILGGYVDDQTAATSLQLAFGEIAPGKARMGRWWMQTSLSGRFDAMEASYSHADSLGGALTSLIEGEPQTHLLLRDVRVDLAGRDSIRDFLARDGDVLRVYESSNIDTEVTDLSSAASLQNAASPGQFTLVLPTSSTMSYARVDDPQSGLGTAIQAMRADGSSLPAENVWLSKRRNPDLSWSHYINLFDARGGGAFSLRTDLPPAESALRGQVYLDANDNGQRDPDEVGLAEVTVLLDGSSAIGNVQRSSASDEAGAWSFDALPTGTYSVSVEPVQGLLDGLHTPGSAGGHSQVSSISTIVLDQGEVGQGYLFAKRSPASPSSADLRVNQWSGPQTASVGQTVDYHVQVENLGPQGVHTDTLVSLPESFQVASASASEGSFDSASGHWNVGALPPGSLVELQLQGQFGQTGSQTLAASVSSLDPDIDDPDAANNQASLPVEVELAPILNLQFQAAKQARVLAWVDCELAAPAGCAAERAERWATVFAGVDSLVITTAPDAFRRSLRQNSVNIVMVDGPLSQIQSAGLLREVREFVRRDRMLVLSGRRDDAWQSLAQFIGVGAAQSLPASVADVDLLDSEYFESGTHTVSAPLSSFGVGGARLLGSFSSGEPAVVAGRSEAGQRIVLVGFDLLAWLEAGAVDQRLANLREGLSAPAHSPLLPSAPVALDLAASRPQAEGELMLELRWDVGTQWLASSPPPTLIEPSQAQWRSQVSASAHSITVRAGLLAPTLSGAQEWIADASYGSESAEHSLTWLVADGDARHASATTALAAVVATTPEAEAALQQARDLFAQVETALLDGHDEQAMDRLLSVIEALDAVPDVSADSAQLALSYWFEALASRMGEPGIELFRDGFEARP